MEGQKTTPDDIIRELGGCGRYQMIINIVAHMMKILICWSIMGMIIILATPKDWYCDDGIGVAVVTNNSVPTNAPSVNSTPVYDAYKACKTPTGAKCTKFRFEGVSTIVSELNLVCDDAYKTSMIMTIQSGGALVGNLVSGQISDLIGRKRPFFGSVALIIIFNIIGTVYTKHWAFFAACRFLVGIGSSAFMTTKYSLLSEFSLAQHRAWIIGMPSWPLQTSILALVAWLLKEWKYIQYACTIVGCGASC